MACRITCLVLDAHDPAKLAEFWCAVLDYVVLEYDEQGVEIGAPPGHRDEGRQVIDFLHTTDKKLQKLRLHIDVNATDRDQDAELARLLDLGAKPVDIGQGDVSWHVLADPEG
ncbi:MAG: VOC family protein, partial [Sciscionella sp.]|nr:VOC family protein [Sciscionella sp.]